MTFCSRVPIISLILVLSTSSWSAELKPQTLDFTVDRSTLVKAFRELDENPNLIGVQIRPVLNGEEIRGWEFLEVKPQSIFSLMKIKKDDVLLRVESIPVATPGATAKNALPDVFFPDFEKATSFGLLLERKGKPTLIQFHFRH